MAACIKPLQFGRDAPTSLPDWMEWFMKIHHFFEKWVAMNASDITNSNFTTPPKIPLKIWLPAFSYTNGILLAGFPQNTMFSLFISAQASLRQ